jgi:hypothetical protein
MGDGAIDACGPAAGLGSLAAPDGGAGPVDGGSGRSLTGGLLDPSAGSLGPDRLEGTDKGTEPEHDAHMPVGRLWVTTGPGIADSSSGGHPEGRAAADRRTPVGRPTGAARNAPLVSRPSRTSNLEPAEVDRPRPRRADTKIFRAPGSSLPTSSSHAGDRSAIATGRMIMTRRGSAAARGRPPAMGWDRRPGHPRHR